MEDENYWEEISITDKYEDLQLPAFHLGGWYDCFIGPTLTNYVEMVKTGQRQKLIVGPWGHGNFSSVQGECFFGIHASGDWIDLEENITDLHIRWFSHWLKGMDTGVETEAPVKIFVMGINKWRDEMEWPLERNQYTNFYLHSNGKANTKKGDGHLTVYTPFEEIADTFTYDPKKYRNGNLPEKALSGEIVAYEIDLWVTSNVFLPRHQITLEISSSNFPQYAPNPNTGKSMINSKETVKAHQIIYHNKQYPSHMILPIIPMLKSK
ncbi:CocE/NonD family hydrolase [Neobacillus pocheonensis]|uniref:CocE/NonD family hydrolase n=1 Tax=Neobacillus pocheonensis TaxID=363869 RepID=A0ABT0W9Q5_9BACI|nr:CocE/NonD family hydrolase [Neobacillus pocheonensis]